MYKRQAADPELVILCVPDDAIAGVAQGLDPGPWLAHVSGATPLAALDPHRQRFSVHPLQTLTRARGPEQLDGAWGAISAETDAALEPARWLADTLGLHAFEIADADRPIYHAAAVIGGNYLVTLHRAATRLLSEVGAPAEAIVPLMRRTIENDFELTGPIARGDRATFTDGWPPQELGTAERGRDRAPPKRPDARPRSRGRPGRSAR